MIELNSYNTEGDINENDEGLCDSLVNEYKGSDEEIFELIHYVADSYTEIYNATLFEMGYSLYAKGYCEDAMELYRGSNDFDIIDILKTAHYCYNKTVLQNNIQNIIFNYIANSLNEEGIDSLDDIDVQTIIDDNGFDEDTSFANIDSVLEDVISLYKLIDSGYEYYKSKTSKSELTKEDMKDFIEENGLDTEEDVRESIDELIEEENEEDEEE